MTETNPDKAREAIGRALGVLPDPDRLTAERDQARAALADREARLRGQALELAVHRQAGRYGGSAARLTDSVSFMARVSRLDPASDSFDAELGAAISAAVESGPRFRADPAANAARTTAPPARPDPGPGVGRAAGGQWTLDDVKAASPSETLAALEEGKLAGLGCGPSRRR